MSEQYVFVRALVCVVVFVCANMLLLSFRR